MNWKAMFLLLPRFRLEYPRISALGVHHFDHQGSFFDVWIKLAQKASQVLEMDEGCTDFN